ncbi:MAG: FemAB family XrtA/PEP-CTERM system-associated protein [Candidatus Acidiferrum sp.]
MLAQPEAATAAALSKPVRVSEPATIDRQRWDGFVLSRPEASFFHLSGWKRVIERAFGHSTHYLQAERGTEITGVLPLTHIKSRFFGNALISNGFCVYGGPVARDDESRRALEAAAIELMRRVGANILEFRTIEQTHPEWPNKSDLYVTFRRPLHPEPDANMKAIPRKQRAMVRKGIQNELRSEIDLDVGRLHPVYAESVRNLGTPVFPKCYFNLLKEEFGPACDIVTITHERKAVASVMSFYFRDEVLPYYGGGTAKARTLAANDFMYWEVMRRACERGYRTFDFGRSKIGTGSFAFKRNWGFEPTRLIHQYQLAPGASIPNVNPLNPKYRLFIALWRRLPLPLSELIGPFFARNLG